MERASWWNERLWNSRFQSPNPSGGVQYTSHFMRTSRELESKDKCEVAEESTAAQIISNLPSYGISSSEKCTAMSQSSFPQSSLRQTVNRPVTSSFRPATPNRQRPLGSLRICYLSRPFSASDVGKLTERNTEICQWSIDPIGSGGVIANSTRLSVGNRFSRRLHCNSDSFRVMAQSPLGLEHNKATLVTPSKSSSTNEPLVSSMKERKYSTSFQTTSCINETITSGMTSRNSFSARVPKIYNSIKTELPIKNRRQQTQSAKFGMARGNSTTTAEQVSSTRGNTAQSALSVPTTNKTTQMDGTPMIGAVGSAPYWCSRKSRSSTPESTQSGAIYADERRTSALLSGTPASVRSTKSSKPTSIRTTGANNAIKQAKSDYWPDRPPISPSPSLNLRTVKTDYHNQHAPKRDANQEKHKTSGLDGNHNSPTPPISLSCNSYATSMLIDRLMSEHRNYSINLRQSAQVVEKLPSSTTTTAGQIPSSNSLSSSMCESQHAKCDHTTGNNNAALRTVDNEVKLVVCTNQTTTESDTGFTTHNPNTCGAIVESQKNIKNTQRSLGKLFSYCNKKDSTSDAYPEPVQHTNSKDTAASRATEVNNLTTSTVLQSGETSKETKIPSSTSSLQKYHQVLAIQHQPNSKSEVSALGTSQDADSEDQKLINNTATVSEPKEEKEEEEEEEEGTINSDNKGICTDKTVNPIIIDDETHITRTTKHLTSDNLTPQSNVLSESQITELQRKHMHPIESIDSCQSFVDAGPSNALSPTSGAKIQTKSILKRSVIMDLPSATNLVLTENQQQPSDISALGRHFPRRTCSARSGSCYGQVEPQFAGACWPLVITGVPRRSSGYGYRGPSAKGNEQRPAVRFDMTNNLVFEFHPFDYVQNPYT